MSKYFLNGEVYFQNKKLPPQKTIVTLHEIFKRGNVEYVECLDEDKNDYMIMTNKIYDDNNNPIKDARERLNLTQKEFAEFINMPKRTLEDWERGVSQPPVYVIDTIIEKAFAVANMEVVTRKDDMIETSEETSKKTLEEIKKKFLAGELKKEWFSSTNENGDDIVVKKEENGFSVFTHSAYQQNGWVRINNYIYDNKTNRWLEKEMYEKQKKF